MKKDTFLEPEDFQEAFGITQGALNDFDKILEAFELEYPGTTTSVRISPPTVSIVIKENKYNLELPEAFKGYRVLV